MLRDAARARARARRRANVASMCICKCAFANCVLPAPHHSLENFISPYWAIVAKAPGSPDGNMIKKMVNFTVKVLPDKTMHMKIPILTNMKPIKAKEALSIFEAADPEASARDDSAKRRRVTDKSK